MKRISLFVLLLMLITVACTNNVNKPDEKVNAEEDQKENPEDTEIDRTGILSGEIITDGIYGDSGKYVLYFIPDKETREFLYNDYPIEIGESVPLQFEDLALVKDIPKELGVYKVEIDADFTANKWAADLKSIKMIDDIGTVEYHGKTYETNDLDENVQPKDRVCGLIVENVRRFNDGGVIIGFEGEIESEGFYNVYPGGDVFQYNRIGKIIIDKEYKKNFPTYKGVGNNFSVWFTETNELYDELSSYSAIGRGKFKSSNYYIVYNYGISVGPGEILTEIVSLDENYKDLFEYNENQIEIMGFDEDYLIAVEHKIDVLETIESKYYFINRSEPTKIEIASSDDKFGYSLERSNDDMSKKDGTNFKLISRFYSYLTDKEEKSHIIGFRYFNKENTGNNTDLLTKDVNYGIFKDGENTVEVYEGDSYLGMVAEDISVIYHCRENMPEELASIRVKFIGETTLKGKLNVSKDDEFGYQVFFITDSEGTSKLPQHIEDTREPVGFRFVNDNLKEILGEESFSKDCEITIKDYNIHYAATEASNTAELVSVKFIGE